MTQYNFDVNIEKRMPTTGKVFFVDRMTSDYAVAHPFNVDEFIESVCLKYEQLAQEDAAFFGGIVRDRNSLHQMWNKTMQMPVRGDASLYPNRDGRREPALMEVWLKAGDYWRRGFRLGDLLPAILPGTRITRLEGGEWICLFEKDMQLLQSIQSEQQQEIQSIQSEQPQEIQFIQSEQPQEIQSIQSEQPQEIQSIQSEQQQEIQSIQSEPATPNLDEREQSLEVPCQAEISQIETNLEEGSQSENQTEEDLKDSEGFLGETDSKRQEPVQLDLFAQMQQEIAQLRQEQQRLQAQLTLERRQRERTAAAQVQTAEPVPAEDPSAPRPRRVRRPQQSRQWSESQEVCRPSQSARPSIPQSVAATAPTKREYPAWAKGLACMVAASVALVVIYNTGLLIPLGLIGLATSGLIK